MVARFLILLWLVASAAFAQETVSPFYGYTGSEGHILLKENDRAWSAHQRGNTRTREVCVIKDEDTGERIEVPCRDHRQFCRTDVWDKKKQHWVVNKNCDLTQKAPPGFYQGAGQYYQPDRDRHFKTWRDTRAQNEREITRRERAVEPTQRSEQPREDRIIERAPRNPQPRERK